MKKTAALMIVLVSVLAATSLTACGRQSTPSMMNASLPQVVPETTLEQIAVSDISQSYLYNLANNYERFGANAMQISLAYDPKSKSYNAMKAFQDLSDIKAKLKKLGVRSITGETVKSEGVSPTLMISYDSLSAQAPEGCRNMPGFDDGLTTTEIGNYRFGCSTDSMLAKQIYRPADLMGKDESDPIDGRKATNTIEYYRHVDPEEATGELERFDRTDIEQ